MQISTVAQSASPASTNAQTNRASDGGQGGSGDFASLLFPQASGKSENTEVSDGLKGDTGKDQQQPSSQQQQAAAQVILQMMGLSGLVSVLPAKATEAAVGVGNVSSAADQTTTSSVSANHAIAEDASATGVVNMADFSNWIATNVLSGAGADAKTATPASSGQDTIQAQTGHTAASPTGALSGSPDITAQSVSGLSMLQTVEQEGKPSQAIPTLVPSQGADTTTSASTQTAATPTSQSETAATTSPMSSLNLQAATSASTQTPAIPTSQSGAAATTSPVSSLNVQAATFTSTQNAATPTSQSGATATTSPVNSSNVQATVSASTQTAAVPALQSGAAATATPLSSSNVQATVSASIQTAAVPALQSGAVTTASSVSSSNVQATVSTSTQTAAVPALQSGVAASASSVSSSAMQVAPVFAQTVAESDSHPTPPAAVNPVNVQAVSPDTMITGTAEPASNGTATQSGTGGGHSAASSGQNSQNTAGKADTSVQTFPSVLPGLSGQTVTASSVQSPVSSYSGTVAKQITSAVQDAYVAQRSELRVHLSPEDLGGITIKMVSQGGSLTVSIIADSHHTGQMLASGLDSLKNTLQSNGVPVQKAEVSYTPSDTTGQQPAPQQYTGQNSQQQGRHTPNDSQQEPRDTSETSAGFASLVNLFA